MGAGMKKIVRMFAVIALVALASGCSMMAPQYSASLTNVQALKDGGDFSAKVGEFSATKDPGNVNPISIRGSSLSSPYGGSYALYLAEAVKQELSLAGKLSSGADVEISGVLQKNDLDGSGFSKGAGVIEARFVVKKSGQVRYDQVKLVNTEWESSFVGAVAIPKAQQEYPVLVQKLLAALYADPAFIKALK
jgi:hypothetical protein